MKVSIINYTKDARELLLLTKHTRLSKSVEDAMIDIYHWSEEKKAEELDYMLKTIQSSWEFVDFTFLIEGVSRAFTHQFVRTRTGSFAQQSQRTVDMSEGEFEFITPKNIGTERGDDGFSELEFYQAAMRSSFKRYSHLVNNMDTPPQDARGVLPTNSATSIIGKFSLRTLSDMAKKRLCPRTQGEYQDVFKAMREAVIELYPWTEKFLRVYCAAVGVCQFPNFKECPIKGGLFNPETGMRWDGDVNFFGCDGVEVPEKPNTLEEQQKLWENMDYEATPKWKGRS